MTTPISETEVDFTKAWWASLLKDEAKLTAWLQKLQLTEIGGHDDWVNFEETFYSQMTGRDRRITHNIALDEMKHSNTLLNLFEDRGISPKWASATNASKYWTTMYEEIRDFKTCCAVNYYGEALAAFRFEVIEAMPQTPHDIKEFIRLALPDEIFHRESLQRLAGEEALAKVHEAHIAAHAALKRS